MNGRLRRRWHLSSLHRRRLPTHEPSIPTMRRPRFEPLEDRLLLSITVNTLIDEADGSLVDGDVSLRDAIALAPPGETIDFAPVLTSDGPATIALMHGQLLIEKNLTVHGPGAALLTIDASKNDPTPTQNKGDGSRVLQVLGAGIDVELVGMTLTGGDVPDSGGAIRNDGGDLTVSQCTLSNNAADDVATSVGRGGGIFNLDGTLTVNDSTISGNSAESGGGILSNGVVNLNNSTISGNSASSYGGGIVSNRGDLTLLNCTISGNSANDSCGGIQLFNAVVSVIRYSTITGNRADADNNADGEGGGIIAAPSPVVLEHTIVAGNFRGTSARDDIAGLASAHYSLIGDSTGATITSLGGSRIGNSGAPIDPKLGPLADNGGRTRTHALLSGSVAIEGGDFVTAGAGGVPLYDQRGAPFTRVFDGDGVSGARIDIGAYERQMVPGLPFIVDTLVDESDGDYSSGDLSLREAIGLANGSSGGNLIGFSGSLTSGGPATISLTLGEIAISDNVSISGPAISLLTINAFDPTPTINNGDGNRIFSVDDGSATLLALDISRLALRGGDVSGPGGAIRNLEGLLVQNSEISGNAATESGGGIYSLAANLTLIGTTISSNTASNGAGILVAGGTATVTSSTISGNSTFGGGGGILNFGGSLSVRHSTITANIADAENNLVGSGGGIAGPATLDHTILFNSRGSGALSDIAGSVNANFSLISTTAGATITGTSNLVNVNPLLGPRLNNGGLTSTHALLIGSPAINAGNPAAAAGVGGVPSFDQRGAPFSRVSGGQIDIGAVERQPIPPALFGDYNQNGVVDTADYVVWRKTLTNSVTRFSGADGDGDGTVDPEDYGVWRSHFGQTVPAPAAGSGVVELALNQAEFGVAGEAAVSASAETTAPSVEAKLDSAIMARAIVFDDAAGSHDFVSLPAKRINVPENSQPPAENLLLLLAINRVGRSTRQDVSVADDGESDDQHVDNTGQPSFVDEPLALSWP
jgi:hypothetical protein